MEEQKQKPQPTFREPGPIRAGDKVFLRGNKFGIAACEIYPDLRYAMKLGDPKKSKLVDEVVVLAVNAGYGRKAAHVQASWMARPCMVWIGALSLDHRAEEADRKKAWEAKKAEWAAKRTEKADAKAKRAADRAARKAAKCQSSAS